MCNRVKNSQYFKSCLKDSLLSFLPLTPHLIIHRDASYKDVPKYDTNIFYIAGTERQMTAGRCVCYTPVVILTQNYEFSK